MPQQALTDQEIADCFPVISELRPHLEATEFIALVRQMESEGYRLAYLRDSENVVAVAGYRISTNLFMGKNLYVDDLVTGSKFRSKGFGETLLTWLHQLAVSENCKVLHLDSGTQRHQAHKFYFRQGMVATSFHFAMDVIPKS